MRILIAHNRYKFAGGEDSVMRAELAMLSGAGHEVEIYEVDNHTIQNTRDKISAAASLFYSENSSREMSRLLKIFHPDILHIHNWFPLLSPSVIGVAADAGIPVVQTLHNFRMLCANAILYRNGKVCHDCLGKTLPLGAAVHGCYSESHIGSALIVAAFAYHRLAHTWRGVTTFIALSEFQRSLLIQGGLDPAQIVVKPNFVRDSVTPESSVGNYALFVGRLTPEKGIRAVLAAWRKHRLPIALKIMGNGPLVDEVREMSADLPGVEYLGQRATPEVYAAMAGAKFLIFPSEWYEPFALTIVEAFSRGTPVLAADLESIAELVKDGETGWRFIPGNADDLALKAMSIFSDDEGYQAIRRRCRQVYLDRYTEKTNYGLLLSIYENAVTSQAKSAASRLGSKAKQAGLGGI